MIRYIMNECGVVLDEKDLSLWIRKKGKKVLVVNFPWGEYPYKLSWETDDSNRAIIAYYANDSKIDTFHVDGTKIQELELQ